MLTLASLLALAYLPGAVIFRLPVGDREVRAALSAEERLFWAVVLSMMVSTTTALVLAAMGMYTLGALVACNLLLSAGLGLACLRRWRLGPSARGPRWTSALPVVLIAVCGWMYLSVPAAENVLGGRDPGVYMNEGIQIAQRRSLVTHDANVTAVPAESRDLFFPESGDPSYHSLRFMGFHLRDPEHGTVSGQFPQGYPIWIAIAYGLDGVTGTRRVIAWWAILGVLAVYFAGTRLIGPIPAAAAAGLLAIHVIETWYARYPNSEIVTQALLFAAFLAHAYAHQDDDSFFGPIAASLLGLALFTRLPAILAVGAAVGASLLGQAHGYRLRKGFLLVLTAWSVAAAAYYMTQLRPYVGRPIGFLQSLQVVHMFGLAVAAVSVLVLLWAIRRPGIAAFVRTWLPAGLIVAVTVSGTYAFFFREPGDRLAPHDAYALRTFANLYLTSLTCGLAFVGYALVVWRSFWRAPALILGTTLLAFFFLYKLRIWPEHFWLARRFIPAILPASLLFAAAAIFAPLWMLTRERLWGGRRTIGTAAVAIGVLVVTLLGQHYLVAAQPIRTHIEYAGLIPHIERLAAGFGNDDLVLVEARAASDVHTLALPLAYIYARNVLVLHSARPDKASVLRFLAWARPRYRNVYFMAGGGTDLLSPGVGAEVVTSERFQVPEYERTAYDVYPRSVLLKPFDFTIYRLIESSTTAAPHLLDIGGADDLYLVGFHPKERLGGGDLTFRWTGGTSSLLMGMPPGGHELLLRMNSGRPQGVPQPRVTIFLEGREIGNAEPTPGLRDYSFPIPATLASELLARNRPVEIQVVSTTWIPRDVLGGTDSRALGVMVDRAEIR